MLALRVVLYLFKIYAKLRFLPVSRSFECFHVAQRHSSKLVFLSMC